MYKYITTVTWTSWCMYMYMNIYNISEVGPGVRLAAAAGWVRTYHDVQYDWCRLGICNPSISIWKPDHLARFSIWEHILRCPPYIMSYSTMLPYNSVWKSRKSYISWYTRYISRYTIGQKYISEYTVTEIYFWPIVYLEIYDYTCNSVYVSTSQYEILR